MRIRKLMTIPILMLLLAGCIKEDRSQCPEREGVTFLFSYGGECGSEFTNRIQEIDLFVFDSEGKYLFTRTVQTADLDPGNPSISLDLDAGTYYAVAWANVGDNSVYQSLIPGVTTLEECLIEIAPASAATGDQIYYAPGASTDPEIYKVVVPPGKEVVQTLDFVRAHRTIYVWISGLEDADDQLPTVEAQGLWCSYDFTFCTGTDRRDFTQQSAECIKDDKTYALAVFHHAYGEIDDDMNVLIYLTSNGELLTTVNLRQFLEDHPATGTDDIHIMLTFTFDLGVTVSLPQWISTSVQPGID